MLAVLSSTTFDPLGYVALEVMRESANDGRLRRVTRIGTLDGGAVFNDAGYANADRTITLRWLVTDAATEAAVDRLMQLYSRLVLSLADAVYLVAPEAYSPGTNESSLTLLVAEKLTT